MVTKGTPPPKEKTNSNRQPSDPPGRPGRLYGSDGGPRQRPSETFPISRTEFEKSFLRWQAQSVVILSTDSQPYGMIVNPE